MFKITIKSLEKSIDLFKVFKNFTKPDVSLLKFGTIYCFLGFVVTLQHVLNDWNEML